MGQFHLIILTGMSGSGKSHALQILETMGYFCIDNIPPALIPEFASICAKSGGDRVRHVAVSADIGDDAYLGGLEKAVNDMRDRGISCEVVFMEASERTLISRYKEMRRVHPFAVQGRISKGIEVERERFAQLRRHADVILDTTGLTMKELREVFRKKYTLRKKDEKLSVTVVSFGFKYGIPIDADIVEDVRFFPNPFYVEALRHSTGRVPAVRDYVEASDVTRVFKEKWFSFIDFLLPHYKAEGKGQLVIAVGCTGGLHRSVAMAEAMYKHLREQQVPVTIEHRDMDKNEVKCDAPGYEGDER